MAAATEPVNYLMSEASLRIQNASESAWIQQAQGRTLGELGLITSIVDASRVGGQPVGAGQGLGESVVTPFGVVDISFTRPPRAEFDRALADRFRALVTESGDELNQALLRTERAIRRAIGRMRADQRERAQKDLEAWRLKLPEDLEDKMRDWDVIKERYEREDTELRRRQQEEEERRAKELQEQLERMRQERREREFEQERERRLPPTPKKIPPDEFLGPAIGPLL